MAMPKAEEGLRRGSWLGGLFSQFAVIRSLVLRELQQRYGRSNIGYLWVVAEPMMLAGVVTLLHSLVSSDGADMSPYTFTLTGYAIFIIFRNTFNKSDAILHNSEALFHHRMITPFDLIFAMMVIDTLGCVSALLFLQTFGIVLGLADMPFRPLYLFGAICLFAWFSTGMTMVAAAYSYGNPLLERLIHPISYFSMPLSGAFITVTFLPTWARHYMLWNPMVSIFEMARYGQFEHAPSEYFSPGYVVAVSALTTYWGLLAIRRVRKHIHVP